MRTSKKTYYNYMKLKSTVMGVLCALVSMSVSAQITVGGKVVNAETGKPVSGATVRVNKTLQKAVTNGEGEFKITHLKNEKHDLSVTHVSYEPQQVRVNGSQTDLVVKMVESRVNVGQVVVTGTGTHHRLKDSPVPVQVFTSQDIAAAQATTLDEALQKLMPSLTSMTNGMGTYLTLNGLTDDYFVFLLNGRKMGADDTFQRINVSNIKRIEVLNGASSTLYGTNALGGVVNIITDDAKNSISASAYTKVMSKGRINEDVNLDIQKGKIGSYTSYRHQQADTWQLSPYEEKKGKLVETEKIASAGFHQDVLSQRFTFDASDKLSFYAMGHYYRNKTDRPIAVYDYDLKHETFGYGAGVKLLLNKGNYLTADYTTDIAKSAYCYIKDKGKTIKVGDELTRKRIRYHEASLKGIFNLGERNKLSVGTDFIVDALKSSTDSYGKKETNTFAVFMQDEIQLTNRLQALVGLRYLYNKTFHSYATPNLSLMYNLGDFNLRATYAAGYKAPTLSDIYATETTKNADRLTIGNLDLKPEKNNYFSLNGEYTKGWLSASASVFYNKVRDLVDYVTIAEGKEAMEKYGHELVRQRQNINKSSIFGVNVNMNANLGYGFSANAGYTYLKAQDDATKLPLDRTVKSAYVLGAQWAKTWDNYALHVNLNGRIYSRRYSTTYGYAPHYNMWDIVTRHAFSLKKFMLEPGVGVENIFNWTDNRPYNSNYATLSPGRTVYVSLALKFKD
ncbi:MAG: TonB-dependent receptor [Prevotella sp.]|nr:TonB-dependent receptor [Prevotella sp.]